MNAKTMQTRYAQILIRCLAVLTCATILLPANPQVLARAPHRSVDDQAVTGLGRVRVPLHFFLTEPPIEGDISVMNCTFENCVRLSIGTRRLHPPTAPSYSV